MSPEKMSTFLPTFLLVLAMATSTSTLQQPNPLQMARTTVTAARTWVQASVPSTPNHGSEMEGVALLDCLKVYKKSESLLTRLLLGQAHSRNDAVTWLSAVVANHRSCLNSLTEKGFVEARLPPVAQNLTSLLSQALQYLWEDNLFTKALPQIDAGGIEEEKLSSNGGLLATWNAATSRADFVVANDGSGTHRSINAAVAQLRKMGKRRGDGRVIIYVKSGVYSEKVEIEREMKNVMFVGDGMDKTIVTASSNVPDGASTFSSATFGISGDGFWARDMTFENTAGPHKQQAVAMRVSSDLSIFYRCRIKGYQDTLFVHSLRQFYRDCEIHGTIDFIFGDAPAVLQNCDIVVRKPMEHQANMITAQGRENPNENTGISIHNSRVRPAADFMAMKNSFKTYLGRPWKKYSRTVFIKTDLDGMIDPKGWREWDGNFALSTLYYGEYMNTGVGASTTDRVRWPGFHVLRIPPEAEPFSVSRFIQGESWIPATGVPCWLGI